MLTRTLAPLVLLALLTIALTQTNTMVPLTHLLANTTLHRSVLPELQQFAARDLSRPEASIVIVGDGRRFLTVLRQKFPNVEVIAAADLDLNRGSLRKQRVKYRMS